MKHRESMPPEGRDQVPTTFSEILQELLWQEPRAAAAVLIDPEGETVDYASSLPSYDTKVAAANLRVVLDNMADAWKKTTSGDTLTEAILRAPKRSFFVRPLADGYALVLILRRRAFAVSARAVALAVCRLAKEARWPAPLEETLPWHPVEIETSRADRFRPMQMKTDDAWDRVEVLGSVVGLASEKGYRCRLQEGAEITLVRESTGVWFVDQPIRGLASRLGPQSVPPARAPSHPPSSTRGASQRASQPPGKTPSEGPAAEGRPPAESAAENRVRTSAERGDMWAKWTKRL